MKELVERAGAEIGDLIVMIFDDVPNGQQIGDLAAEGLVAVKDLANAIGQVPKDRRAAALSHFLNKVHERANAGIPQLKLE